MRLIPAIDIIEGKCVRLTQGQYHTVKVYHDDPLEVALEFENHGIEYLHLVDLEGAKESKSVNLNVLEKIARKTNLKIDFGGGMKSKESMVQAFSAGAHQVTIGSLAIKNELLVVDFLKEFGSQQIIIGADYKKGNIAINGWTENTQESISSFIHQWTEYGANYFIATNIHQDGTLRGPDFDTYQMILEQWTPFLIASGGVSHVKDLHQLKNIGLGGAIIGKAYYEKCISLNEMEDFILSG
ncbi:MAG: 1-(5-phosphoribosyl)-5-[(5-phosphoribosylamino)methylideneamino]imidazole-4-carboxamide isomerase [Flavobacteriaceae bacterium]|nr:1-(5-phosphoribosyl)-5-[(5-phosphoribosylamino)methylideneamino]imidazole-4-carboxamide isomerase [Flavobacteriaceae bacterium]MCY4266672.1 1-(5-phosphoribosyl)-5-[(5-phosphoribosylamino)methylideneamino]imidazole-4-carboxamide isomerase [Flavobacteriaceae bacterium]